MISKKARLKDIAILSGVSIGTVDRVLHNRGQVADKTRKKVLRIARELKYTPNIMARALKTKKRYTLVSLLPHPTEENLFWVKHPQGMEKAMAELDQFPVNLIQFTFDMNSEDDFQQKARDVLLQKPDGIVLAPVFRSESISFCNELKKNKIPFVFIDNFLTETGFMAYVGEDIFRSGRVAGQLADIVTPPEGDILIVNLAKNIQNMHHLNKRAKGFRSFFSRSSVNKGKKINLNIPGTEAETVAKYLSKAFIKNDNISTIFVTGSKSFKVAEYLGSSGHKPVNVIGYDLIDSNVNYLKKGIIRFLLGQRPEEQAFRAVKKLFDYLSFNKVPEKMDYLPVDIVTSENVEFFLNHH